MKTGLILEGGAMRGLFSAGVLDVFLEKGITFDAAIGVSAGAAFGCNLKSHQAGRVLRYNTAYCRDKRYCSLHSLITTGDLYGADFCYRELPDVLDPFDYETYRRDPMDFYVTCTDADTGLPAYRLCNRLDREEFLWMRASASMPIVSRPVEVGGRRLLDGGISDSVPLSYFQSLGYEKCVLVLTRPKGYRKKPLSHAPLLRPALRQTPEVAEALCRRHEHYNRAMDEIEQQEKEGRIFVLRPPMPIQVKMIEKNPERLKSAWKMGRYTALGALPELNAFLQK